MPVCTNKRCEAGGADQSADRFGRDGGKPGGRRLWCKVCVVRNTRERRDASKLEPDFVIDVAEAQSPGASNPSAQYTREPPLQPPANRDERREREAQVGRYLSYLAGEEHDRLRGNLNRAAALGIARNRLFLAQVEEVASRVFKDKIQPSAFALTKSEVLVERHLHLVLSDLHFGSMLDPREVPRRYGHVEEARRLAAVVAQAADYKPQYREQTALNVNLLGDLIQGQLHDPRDGAPLAEQACAAIWCLCQAISFLSSTFSRVYVRCTPGNHGRFKSRHQERAINQKWDALETVIYYAIKQAAAALPNVTIEIPYAPYFAYDTFGSRVFATHGDTVLSPGSPWRTINVRSLEQQVSRINAALPDASEYGVFVLGHVHFAARAKLQNGSVVITNGCLLPPDPFAVSQGNLETACSQTLWESVPGYPAGDYRTLDVDERTDLDERLDKLIRPYAGL